MDLTLTSAEVWQTSSGGSCSNFLGCNQPPCLLCNRVTVAIRGYYLLGASEGMCFLQFTYLHPQSSTTMFTWRSPSRRLLKGGMMRIAAPCFMWHKLGTCLALQPARTSSDFSGNFSREAVCQYPLVKINWIMVFSKVTTVTCNFEHNS